MNCLSLHFHRFIRRVLTSRGCREQSHASAITLDGTPNEPLKKRTEHLPANGAQGSAAPGPDLRFFLQGKDSCRFRPKGLETLSRTSEVISIPLLPVRRTSSVWF